ncbi:16S rRNA (cytosine(967)-C(5))-methyltransferase RsmB [Clostridium bornimense]|uniref:16S rRNA (cytosine(967)-C(5))-methyltransferase RsmB n=1 Tax=Clostridium bornimense TaxID=1216932 RepID=UPI001C0FC6D8|nr:16S rRNA (cytosine(967)-C(5))-methyltransferase RsmB [Clostridium bornimense]MBU5316299.1 16S rRNA (cytosine(967)-C(5))-methyltransferase RsmB [Clostridium bornimense]
MKSGREVAVEVLDEVFFKKAYSNIALNNALNKSNVRDIDKGLITELVYGTLKHKYTIDEIIKAITGRNIRDIDKFSINIIRITIYQLKYLSRIPEFAAVNEAVELTKKRAGIKMASFVNAVVRTYIRGDKKPTFKNIDYKEAFKYSLEPWMIQSLRKDYGTYSPAIFKGLNERPAVTVRVNCLKGDYDDVFAKLEELGYEVNEGFVSPDAIEIVRGKSIEENPLFKEGYITVQDESAMLVASIMDLEEGFDVLDVCAAPGGKTTHIAELMNNKGKVVACDIHENKLKLVEENAERLGIDIIETKTYNGEEFNEEFENSFDRVLIDVPCSGLGIIRKKPEIKWEKKESDISSIQNIQRNIMKNASKYVKKDGVLVYSTCTLNLKENDGNVKWFLENNPDYEIEKVFFGALDNMIYDKLGYVTILPNKSMDGFFMAKFRRK